MPMSESIHLAVRPESAHLAPGGRLVFLLVLENTSDVVLEDTSTQRASRDIAVIVDVGSGMRMDLQPVEVAELRDTLHTPWLHVAKDWTMRLLDSESHERILVRTTHGIRSRQPAERLGLGVRRGGALRSSCLVLLIFIAFICPGGAWAGTANGAVTGMMNAHLAMARAGNTVMTLPGGGILTAGGLDAVHRPTARAQFYDPRTGVWAATGSLHEARAFHTATLLPAGKVLVAGGYGVAGYVASAALYEPRSGTWTTTGALCTARAFHTATLLPTGHVLVAGGSRCRRTGQYTCVPLVLDSAALYDPRSGTWETTEHMVISRVSSTMMLRGAIAVLAMGQDGLPVQRYVVQSSRMEMHDDRPWVGGSSPCRGAGRRLKAGLEAVC